MEIHDTLKFMTRLGLAEGPAAYYEAFKKNKYKMYHFHMAVFVKNCKKIIIHIVVKCEKVEITHVPSG